MDGETSRGTGPQPRPIEKVHRGRYHHQCREHGKQSRHLRSRLQHQDEADRQNGDTDLAVGGQAQVEPFASSQEGREGPSQDSHIGTLMLLSSPRIISVCPALDWSAECVATTRWCNTQGATRWTSSGKTNARPSTNPAACAARNSIKAPRGLHPTRSRDSSRVRRTISTMYLPIDCSTRTLRTCSWQVISSALVNEAVKCST